MPLIANRIVNLYLSQETVENRMLGYRWYGKWSRISINIFWYL